MPDAVIKDSAVTLNMLVTVIAGQFLVSPLVLVQIPEGFSLLQEAVESLKLIYISRD